MQIKFMVLAAVLLLVTVPGLAANSTTASTAAAKAADAQVVPQAANSAQAGALTQLREFIANVSAAKGAFSQQASDEGKARHTLTGQFSFQRPGKFRWEVMQPYKQLIVSDGEKLQQYDPDLAQVTQRPVDQSIGASPAAILFGAGVLDDSFSLKPLPDDDGLKWLRATPHGPDAGFAYVDIGFRHGLPARILLLDAFGQTTRVDLSDIQVNPVLPANQFRFVPPQGVDVVNMQ